MIYVIVLIFFTEKISRRNLFFELDGMLTLAMRVPSYDGFDVVVLSADTVI